MIVLKQLKLNIACLSKVKTKNLGFVLKEKYPRYLVRNGCIGTYCGCIAIFPIHWWAITIIGVAKEVLDVSLVGTVVWMTTKNNIALLFRCQQSAVTVTQHIIAKSLALLIACRLGVQCLHPMSFSRAN